MPGKLTRKDTEFVDQLAKLNLTSSEIDNFTPQLSAVVDLINELNEVDTENIEPTAQTTKLTNVLRNDEIKVENCLTQEEAMSGTENTQNGFITVPQILQK